MSGSVKQVAREVEAHPVVHALARGGYAADGVVHLLLGAIFIAVALGAPADGDQSGAFTAIATLPAGFLAVWVVAILLWALGLYHLIAAILVRSPKDARRWGRRISEVSQAAGFVGLGVIAAIVALGGRAGGDEARETSHGVLATPGGPLLIGAIGLGVAGAGAAFIGMGIARSFAARLTVPAGVRRLVVHGLGVVGYVAKGVALGVAGILLVIASINHDASIAGGLDAAVRALLDMMLGPVLVTIVGSGVAAYGLFLLCRARYADL